jgi:hypothetical protein
LERRNYSRDFRLAEWGPSVILRGNKSQDRMSPLQLLGEKRDSGAPHAEHFCQEFLRQQELLAAGPVGALQQPAAQSRRAIVNGVASGVLLRFRPHRLGIAHDEIAQRRAATGRVFEARGRNRVIAKLDRLSRNLAFIATLMDSGVEFVAVDNPHANKLTVHILAAVAQHERELIAQRTKDALQAAKARGVVLGNPKLDAVRDRAVASVKADADRFAKNVAPIIREIQSSGVASHRAIARSLNARGVATARGGQWTAVQVGSILRRVVTDVPC